MTFPHTGPGELLISSGHRRAGSVGRCLYGTATQGVPGSHSRWRPSQSTIACWSRERGFRWEGQIVLGSGDDDDLDPVAAGLAPRLDARFNGFQSTPP